MYPVQIDPLLTNTVDALLQSNQSYARLGFSVAGAGDVNGDGFADVIVGAPAFDAGETDEGAAFVFLGGPQGIEDATASTAATQLESNQADAQLGNCVAGAGDVNGDGYADVIVGAWAYDTAEIDQGAAFVFLGSATGIGDGNPSTAATRLHVGLPGAYYLGNSVAGAGDVNADGYADVIVGSPGGVTLVFAGSAGGIPDGNTATAATRLQSGPTDFSFGASVAGAGDVNGDGYGDVIVGAPYYPDQSAERGGAFVFLGSASGVADGGPASAATRIVSDLDSGLLGQSVASAGDVNGDGYADVILGAPRYFLPDHGGGGAFVFLGGETGIADGSPATAAARLLSDPGAGMFGASVASAGDVNGDGFADVIVGVPGPWDDGAAFVYLGGATGVGDGGPATAAFRLDSPNVPSHGHEQAGISVAGVGDVNGDGYADLIVGDPGYDTSTVSKGGAFVFLGGALGIKAGNAAAAAARFESDQTEARLGASVSGAGDVNGDGFTDVIVGAPNFDAGQPNEGAAFVLLAGETGLADGSAATAMARLESNQADAGFGTIVASAGDLNGDGYADVIVGAPYFDVALTDEGAAFVFLGGAAGVPDGDPSTAAATLATNQAGAHFGWSVAGAGDVNGDTYADVIVGAPEYDSGQGPGNGAAFIFLGGAGGVPSVTPTRRLAPRYDTGEALGWSVAGAGDMDGDGYAEVIVGAPFADLRRWQEDSITDAGAAYVLPGGGGFTPELETVFTDSLRGVGWPDEAWFGFSVAGAGDVNGDGLADVVIGAPSVDYFGTNSGLAWVFLGPLMDQAWGGVWSFEPGARLGWSVAGAGDVNGDGYADIILGAPGSDAGEGASEGAAYVYFGGGEDGFNGTDPALAGGRLESDQAGAQLGASVAGVGDSNGDGYADVIAGAPFFDAGQPHEGALFAFLGNGAGRTVLAQQQSAGGSIIAPWGASQQSDGFRISLRASHPAGAGLVRAEIEACPHGVPFGDSACSSSLTSGWVEVNAGAPDVVLTKLLGGLNEGTLYRWRARVLHAPITATQPGVSMSPVPAHGPWRQLQAQSVHADVRVIPEPGFLVSLGSGLVLLAVLARLRAAL